MVSTKFARSNHAFRVPDVCKNKLKAAEQQDVPYPPDPIYFHYDVDVSFLWFHYVFSGVLALPWTHESGGTNFWESPLPKPTDGQWAKFAHNTGSGNYVGQLQHFEGGTNRVNGNVAGNVPNSPVNFTTGPITIVIPPPWTGPATGEINASP